MIIAGDIGGTKARIGLFERRAGKVGLVLSEQYASKEYKNLEAILKTFLDQHGGALTTPLEAGCFGLPGPVVNGRVKVTNLPWEVSMIEVGQALQLPRVKLVNDLVSTAAAIPTFGPSSIKTIHDSASADRAGSCVVVAPGTGLGHSLIHREAGWSVLLASEGGHANFAPSTDLEIELLRYLRSRLPHVSVESILCGPGIANIYSFLRDTGHGEEPAELQTPEARQNPTPIITTRALENTCDLSRATMDLFCSIFGAHCSNIVLTYLATGGVYLGGGIPPKIIPLLESGAFIEGYLRKGKLRDKVEATPVFIIKDDQAALFGAAAIAATL